MTKAAGLETASCLCSSGLSRLWKNSVTESMSAGSQTGKACRTLVQATSRQTAKISAVHMMGTFSIGGCLRCCVVGCKFSLGLMLARPDSASRSADLSERGSRGPPNSNPETTSPESHPLFAEPQQYEHNNIARAIEDNKSGL